MPSRSHRSLKQAEILAVLSSDKQMVGALQTNGNFELSFDEKAELCNSSVGVSSPLPVGCTHPVCKMTAEYRSRRLSVL